LGSRIRIFVLEARIKSRNSIKVGVDASTSRNLNSRVNSDMSAFPFFLSHSSTLLFLLMLFYLTLKGQMYSENDSLDTRNILGDGVAS
jgi:hypothetical protein